MGYFYFVTEYMKVYKFRVQAIHFFMEFQLFENHVIQFVTLCRFL
jgi:hypothetical protein